MTAQPRIIALCGGIGGAKLVLGLSKILSPQKLTIVVNTGDDFTHLGLPISPDIDTVTYTLAGIANPDTGWGRENESLNCMGALESYGGETWFKLGDKDLAIHLQRRTLLEGGASLTEATARLRTELGIRHEIVPMSDDRVSTVIETREGLLPFQHYFVREQYQPRISGYHFEGIEDAHLSPAFLAALEVPNVHVLICPSNPFISISPIIELPGFRERVSERNIPVWAVSPIIGGKAIKGPTAKMFEELEMTASAPAISEFYGELLTGIIADTIDRDLADNFSTGVRVEFADTLMKTLDDKVALARTCLEIITRTSEGESL